MSDSFYIGDYVKKQIELIDLECQEEKGENESHYKNLTPKQLESDGLCLTSLTIDEFKQGLYGRTLCTFVSSKGVDLPPHQFTPRDVIVLRLRLSGGEAASLSLLYDTTEIEGIVYSISSSSITVAFKDAVESFDGDNRVYTMFKSVDTFTYNQYKTSLKKITEVLDDNSHYSHNMLQVLFHGAENTPSVRMTNGLAVTYKDIDIAAGVNEDGDPVTGSNTNTHSVPLSPQSTTISPFAPPSLPPSLHFTPHVALNKPQTRAVATALSAPPLTLIHGPPGTGKSTVLVEVVRQAVGRGLKVLVCAASNMAVDQLVERLGKVDVPLVSGNIYSNSGVNNESNRLDNLPDLTGLGGDVGNDVGVGNGVGIGVGVASFAAPSSYRKMSVIRVGHPARVTASIHDCTLDSVVRDSTQSVLLPQRRESLKISRELTRLMKIKQTSNGDDKGNFYSKKRQAFQKPKFEGSGRDGREVYRLQKELREIGKAMSQVETEATIKATGSADVIAATLTTINSHRLASLKFDLVIIDECAQALEASCLSVLHRGSRLVLAGDHLQLPPTIKSDSAARDGLGITLFERILISSQLTYQQSILNTSSPASTDSVSKLPILPSWLPVSDRSCVRSCTLLNIQYRMNSVINNWASVMMYRGKLTPSSTVSHHTLYADHDTLGRLDVVGGSESQNNSEGVSVNESENMSVSGGETESRGGVLDCVETRYPWILLDTAGDHLEDGVDSESVEGEVGVGRGESKSNLGEVQLLVEYLFRLFNVGVRGDQVCIITPYRAQVKLIKEMVNDWVSSVDPNTTTTSSSSRYNFPKVPKTTSSTVNSSSPLFLSLSLLKQDLLAIEVGTVDSFQGKEKDVVLISCVRSNPSMSVGFLSDRRRFNVAITRAKKSVVLIGDGSTLASNPFLNSVVEYSEGGVMSIAKNSSGSWSQKQLIPTTSTVGGVGVGVGSDDQEKLRQMSLASGIYYGYTNDVIPDLNIIGLDESYNNYSGSETGGGKSKSKTEVKSVEKTESKLVKKTRGMCDNISVFSRYLPIPNFDIDTNNTNSVSGSVSDSTDSSLNSVQLTLDSIRDKFTELFSKMASAPLTTSPPPAKQKARERFTWLERPIALPSAASSPVSISGDFETVQCLIVLESVSVDKVCRGDRRIVHQMLDDLTNSNNQPSTLTSDSNTTGTGISHSDISSKNDSTHKDSSHNTMTRMKSDSTVDLRSLSVCVTHDASRSLDLSSLLTHTTFHKLSLPMKFLTDISPSSSPRLGVDILDVSLGVTHYSIGSNPSSKSMVLASSLLFSLRCPTGCIDLKVKEEVNIKDVKTSSIDTLSSDTVIKTDQTHGTSETPIVSTVGINATEANISTSNEQVDVDVDVGTFAALSLDKDEDGVDDGVDISLSSEELASIPHILVVYGKHKLYVPITTVNINTNTNTNTNTYTNTKTVYSPLINTHNHSFSVSTSQECCAADFTAKPTNNANQGKSKKGPKPKQGQTPAVPLLDSQSLPYEPTSLSLSPLTFAAFKHLVCAYTGVKACVVKFTARGRIIKDASGFGPVFGGVGVGGGGSSVDVEGVSVNVVGVPLVMIGSVSENPLIGPLAVDNSNNEASVNVGINAASSKPDISRSTPPTTTGRVKDTPLPMSSAMLDAKTKLQKQQLQQHPVKNAKNDSKTNNSKKVSSGSISSKPSFGGGKIGAVGSEISLPSVSDETLQSNAAAQLIYGDKLMNEQKTVKKNKTTDDDVASALANSALSVDELLDVCVDRNTQECCAFQDCTRRVPLSKNKCKYCAYCFCTNHGNPMFHGCEDKLAADRLKQANAMKNGKKTTSTNVGNNKGKGKK